MAEANGRERFRELLERARGSAGGKLTLGSAALAVDVEARPRWELAELAGRTVELSTDGAHGCSLTLAMGLVAQAHASGETAAWVWAAPGVFFPPDAAAAGADLDALVVVRVPDARAGGRAADKLLRSGGFGLVVLDLGDGLAAGRALTPALQGRLQALAERHRCTLMCLTDKKAGAGSLGSSVSLHATSRRRCDGGVWTCELTVHKDRRRGPGWTHKERLRGPPGLR